MDRFSERKEIAQKGRLLTQAQYLGMLRPKVVFGVRCMRPRRALEDTFTFFLGDWNRRGDMKLICDVYISPHTIYILYKCLGSTCVFPRHFVWCADW